MMALNLLTTSARESSGAPATGPVCHRCVRHALFPHLGVNAEAYAIQNGETADIFDKLTGDAAESFKEMNRLCEVRRPMRS